MPQKSKITLKVLLMLFLCAPLALAQQPQDQAQAAAAPVPVQILNARKIFIANAVGDTNISFNHISGPPERTYNELYSSMKASGGYELEANPADAELLFEIHFTAPLFVASGLGHPMPRPQFDLVIRDPKTQALLWTFTEYLDQQKVKGKWSQDKAFDQAILSLMGDIKKLAPPSSASMNDTKK
jgi:hypothetical protein